MVGAAVGQPSPHRLDTRKLGAAPCIAACFSGGPRAALTGFRPRLSGRCQAPTGARSIGQPLTEVPATGHDAGGAALEDGAGGQPVDADFTAEGTVAVVTPAA